MYRLFVDGEAEPTHVKAFHTPRVGDHLRIQQGPHDPIRYARVTKVVHTVELARAAEDDAFQQEIVDLHVSTKE